MSIEDAIRWTIPTGPGHRDTQLMTFARYLKGMQQYAYCDLNVLKPIVRQWHTTALPFIGTKPFEVTWIAFTRAWSRVKYPIGEGPLALIVKDALTKPVPEVAHGYESPEIRNLIVVCCELQRIAGDQPFFLTCRDAAQHIGGDRGRFRWWNELLNLLLADGVVVLHERGGWTKRGDSPNDKPKKATTYFYRGDTPKVTPRI